MTSSTLSWRTLLIGGVVGYLVAIFQSHDTQSALAFRRLEEEHEVLPEGHSSEGGHHEIDEVRKVAIKIKL